MVLSATSEFVARYPSFPAGEPNSKPSPLEKERIRFVNGLSFMQHRLITRFGSAAIANFAKPSTSGLRPRALTMKTLAPAKNSGSWEASRGVSKLEKQLRCPCSRLAIRHAVLREPPEPIASCGSLARRLIVLASPEMST